MPHRILALLFALLLLPLHAAVADTVTVTTRSSGTMVASGDAERLLQLPPGPADYELSFTSTFLDFASQAFALANPPASLVELRVYQNGDVAGQLTGTAERFEVSIVSAVPEPSILAGLCAGLLLLGAAGRWRRRGALP
jgi:hypothetical protein